MQHKTTITPRLPDATFIKITSDNLEVFDNLINEDNNNLTPSDRTTREYNSKLAIDIVSLCKRLSKQTGRKITILDAGCGRCVATKELLSNPELNEIVDCITGISMNYFSNVKRVAKLHRERFIYYYGKVQDVLAAENLKFDLILDSCGAYYYSVDKVRLLQLYHGSQDPGGEAYIVSRNDTILLGELNKNMRPYLTQQYPNTFSEGAKPSILVMKKSLRHFTLPAMRVTFFSETIAGNNKKKSLKTARDGNAVAPDVVKFELLDTSKTKRRK